MDRRVAVLLFAKYFTVFTVTSSFTPPLASANGIAGGGAFPVASDPANGSATYEDLVKSWILKVGLDLEGQTIGSVYTKSRPELSNEEQDYYDVLLKPSWRYRLPQVDLSKEGPHLRITPVGQEIVHRPLAIVVYGEKDRLFTVNKTSFTEEDSVSLDRYYEKRKILERSFSVAPSVESEFPDMDRDTGVLVAPEVFAQWPRETQFQYMQLVWKLVDLTEKAQDFGVQAPGSESQASTLKIYLNMLRPELAWAAVEAGGLCLASMGWLGTKKGGACVLSAEDKKTQAEDKTNCSPGEAPCSASLFPMGTIGSKGLFCVRASAGTLGCISYAKNVGVETLAKTDLEGFKKKMSGIEQIADQVDLTCKSAASGISTKSRGPKPAANTKAKECESLIKYVSQMKEILESFRKSCGEKTQPISAMTCKRENSERFGAADRGTPEEDLTLSCKFSCVAPSPAKGAAGKSARSSLSPRKVPMNSGGSTKAIVITDRNGRSNGAPLSVGSMAGMLKAALPVLMAAVPIGAAYISARAQKAAAKKVIDNNAKYGYGTNGWGLPILSTNGTYTTTPIYTPVIAPTSGTQ